MVFDIERFRALARSSPWRWSTLRYVRLQHPIGSETVPVRVLVRRRKLARVKDLNGSLLRVLREQPQTVTPLSRWGDAPPIALPGATDVDIEVDEGGLVRRRPGRWEWNTDTAMIGKYYDVALLDPVELADVVASPWCRAPGAGTLSQWTASWRRNVPAIPRLGAAGGRCHSTDRCCQSHSHAAMRSALMAQATFDGPDVPGWRLSRIGCSGGAMKAPVDGPARGLVGDALVGDLGRPLAFPVLAPRRAHAAVAVGLHVAKVGQIAMDLAPQLVQVVFTNGRLKRADSSRER